MSRNEMSCAYSIDIETLASDYDPSNRHSYFSIISSPIRMHHQYSLMEDDVWSCPHPSLPNHEMCAFHTPPDETPASVDVSDVFEQALRDSHELESEYEQLHHRQFIGINIESIQLSNKVFDFNDQLPIDLRYSNIKTLDLTGTTLGQDIYMRGSTIDTLRLREAQFKLFDISACSITSITSIDATIEDLRMNNTDIIEISANGILIESGELDNLWLKKGDFSNSKITNVDSAKSEFEAVSFRNAFLQNVSFIDNEMVGARFECITFENARLEYVDLSDAVFAQTNFRRSTIEWTDFDRTRFVDVADFKYAEIDNTVFRGAAFREARFNRTKFGFGAFDSATFWHATFKHSKFRRVDFDRIFVCNIDFSGANIQMLDFVYATIEHGNFDEVNIDKMDFTGVHLGIVSFERATIEEALFIDVTPFGKISFNNMDIGNNIKIRVEDTILDVGYFSLQNTNIPNGELLQPREEGEITVYDLREATISNVILINQLDNKDKLDPLVGKRVVLYKTQFKNFDFSSNRTVDVVGLDYRIHHLYKGVGNAVVQTYRFGYELQKEHNSILSNKEYKNTMDVPLKDYTSTFTLSTSDAIPGELPIDNQSERLISVGENLENDDAADVLFQMEEQSDEEPPWEALEETYLKAKQGANQVGHLMAAGRFFELEMIYRRKKYYDRILAAESINTRLRNGSRWIRSLFLAGLTGYGERPLRPVVISIFTILLFSIFYLDKGHISIQINSMYEIINAIIFSMQAFVTNIHGLGNSNDFWLQAVVALEGLLGAFLVAVLVFVLTRSIHR